MEPKPEGRFVRESVSEYSDFALPNDANNLGNVLGGKVMHLVDIAGALAAARHARCQVVTASVDSMSFIHPIHMGQLIMLRSSVNRVFRTSMEVGVKVFSENALTGERKHTTTAYVTFVALDAVTREPKPVAPLILKTAEEKRRWQEAGERRKARLALRYKKQRNRD